MYHLKILFLGYDENNTSLMHFLKDEGHIVVHQENKIELSYIKDFDFIIVFMYRYIITNDIVLYFGKKIINLHISYLPYGRGSHPVFWSFIENSPKGVTIHVIDKGVDTGHILIQKHVKYKKNENTFRKTHERCLIEIENFFKDNHYDILNLKIEPKKQVGLGSYHRTKDLPPNVDWDMKINDYIMINPRRST